MASAVADLIAAQQPLERVAMVVRRGSDGVPRFAASGFMLASRLAICAGFTALPNPVTAMR